MTEEHVFSFDQVQAEVAKGRKLLIHESKVYDVSNFIKRHPGGELVISHMVGRDATDHIMSFHSPGTVDRYLIGLRAGRMADGDPAINKPISMAFRRLHKKFTDMGLFTPRPSYFIGHLALVLLGFTVAALLLTSKYGATVSGCTLAALSVSFAWHQAGLFMHDGGHSVVTQNAKLDYLICIVGCNAFTGISLGFWKHKHYVHHTLPNEPEHDPEVQHLPIFSIHPRIFDGEVYSTYYQKIFRYEGLAKILVPLQHVTYFIVVLAARFDFFAGSIWHLLTHREKLWHLELLALAFFYAHLYWMISLLPTTNLQIQFFCVAFIGIAPLVFQLFTGHSIRPVNPTNLEETFAERQVQVSMDYDCSKWFDCVSGGLQFHTAHHLFPRMPSHSYVSFFGHQIYKLIKVLF